jgi:DNA-binding LacI/PurR family transcriptional regulator
MPRTCARNIRTRSRCCCSKTRRPTTRRSTRFFSRCWARSRASARRGYDLLISFQQLSNDWQQDYEDSRKADGIILLGYGDFEEYRPRLERLVEQGTHFVRWGPVLEGQPGISVGCDNVQGGYDVTRHLLAAGRRRIAFLGTATSHYPEFFDRYRGYERALLEQRVPTSEALQVDAITTEEAGFQAANELRSRGLAFDAIVAASDLIAIGALRALQEAAVEVPRQVAVVGFDDIPAASLTNPPLTTVMQDTRRAGDLLVETLLRQIGGDAAGNSVIPTRLVVRKSG